MKKLYYNLTDNDIVKLAIYQRWESPERKRYRFFLYTTTIIAFTAAVWAINRDTIFHWKSFVFLAIGLGVVFYIPRFIKKGITKDIKGRFGNKYHKPVGETELEVTEKHLITLYDGIKTEIEWKRITKLVDVKTHLFIFIGDASALIVPATTFSNSNELMEFKRIIEEKKN